jgi:hypothetical protein
MHTDTARWRCHPSARSLVLGLLLTACAPSISLPTRPDAARGATADGGPRDNEPGDEPSRSDAQRPSPIDGGPGVEPEGPASDPRVLRTGLLRGVDSGLCLGVEEATRDASLVAVGCDDLDARVTFEAFGAADGFVLRASGTALCASLAGGDLEPGLPILLRDCAALPSPGLSADLGDDATTFALDASGQCLDLHPDAARGTPLHQWECHGGTNQVFAWTDPEVAPPPPVPTDTINTLDTVIGDMTLPSSARARSYNEAAIIFAGNWAQTQELTSTYGTQMNSVASWCWAFAAEGHPADAQTAVQVRHHEVYYLRESTGRWEAWGGGRPSGWRGDYSAATYEISDEVVIDADTIQVRPGSLPRPDLVSYEMWPPGAGDPTFPWSDDIRAVFATCQMRVVALPGAPPGAIESARYAGQIGFDLWRRVPGMGWERGVTSFDGSCGRMKPITTEWQSFNVIPTMPYRPEGSTLFGELGFGPAWTVPNPFLDPPYTLTLEEIRASPPPLR